MMVSGCEFSPSRSRRDLFVAIDRATRWVFLHIYGDMTDSSSVDFLRRLKLASPINITNITNIPTDNGSQFTGRFTMKDKRPSGQHAFDKVCAGMGIEHRLAPPASDLAADRLLRSEVIPRLQIETSRKAVMQR